MNDIDVILLETHINHIACCIGINGKNLPKINRCKLELWVFFGSVLVQITQFRGLIFLEAAPHRLLEDDVACDSSSDSKFISMLFSVVLNKIRQWRDFLKGHV